MLTLSRKEIMERMSAPNLKTRLVVTPILDEDVQLGPASVDLRLGMRFFGDLRTREPILDISQGERPVSTFFDETYRGFGNRFVVYPGQLVLAQTFEYIKLPEDLMALVISRSTLNRLGIRIMSVVQPGYAGTLSLEITNQSSNPVALYPGMRIVQMVFFPLASSVDGGYLRGIVSKYVANTLPTFPVSDPELDRIIDLGMESKSYLPKKV